MWIVFGIISSPLSALILHLARNSTTLAPWQWLLILEPVPAILIAILVAIFVPSSPLHCGKILTKDEHEWLMREAKSMQTERESESANLVKDGAMPLHEQIARLVQDPRVVLLCISGVCWTTGGYGVGLFSTVILKSGDVAVSTAIIALLDTIPGVLSIGAWEKPTHRKF